MRVCVFFCLFNNESWLSTFRQHSAFFFNHPICYVIKKKKRICIWASAHSHLSVRRLHCKQIYRTRIEMHSNEQMHYKLDLPPPPPDCSHTNTHTHACACAHTHTHSRTHSHSHTLIQISEWTTFIDCRWIFNMCMFTVHSTSVFRFIRRITMRKTGFLCV